MLPDINEKNIDDNFKELPFISPFPLLPIIHDVKVRAYIKNFTILNKVSIQYKKL